MPKNFNCYGSGIRTPIFASRGRRATVTLTRNGSSYNRTKLGFYQLLFWLFKKKSHEDTSAHNTSSDDKYIPICYYLRF